MRLGSDFLDKHLLELESYFSYRNSKKAKVSKVDVAWHLDHSLKTINQIHKTLESSNPKEFKASFSFFRVLVFTWGDFPRRVAKAPRVVRPPEVVLLDDLNSQLEEARENLKKMEGLDKKAHFEQPYFNLMDKRQTKRFLVIHTKHHLKIIRDIVK